MPITLKAARVNAGLDQKTAAAKLNITPETLSSWERAKRFPTVIQISKIEELYGIKYSDINFLPSNFDLNEEKEDN